MHKKTYLAGTIILLGVVLLLAACTTPNAPAAPTTDANAVYTQAAATVSAGLTQSAQRNPTATPTFAPPTETPTAINANPSPTVAQPGPGGETATTTPAGDTAGQATATPAGSMTAVPTTATKASGGTPATTTGDKAQWVSQSPADKTKIQKSATFTMTYILKNTGTTTWAKNYSLRYFAGPMSDPKDTNIIKEVIPGDTVEISFSLVAPNSVGTYTNVWVLSTDQGVNFYTVTLDLQTTD